MNNNKSKNLKNYYKHDSVYGIANRIAYYKNLRDILEAHKTKQADILFRKKLLDNQRRNNYQLEYDRIRQYLHDRHITKTTKEL
jgi:hypothetical protein